MQKDKKKFFKLNILYLLLFVILVAVDQITKAIAFHLNWQGIVFLPNLLEFTTTVNTGSAWSFLGDWKYANLFLVTATSILMLGILLAIYFLPKQKKFLKYGLVCILAGGVGNLIDRIFLKGVRDFIAVPFANFICNIADIAVTVGAILFILALLFLDSDAIFSFSKRKEQVQEENEIEKDMEKKKIETEDKSAK